MLRIENSPETWSVAELEDYVGGQNGRHGLSKPSKMPSYGYSIPAETCKVGSRLRQAQNTVCSGCYAMKGRYVFPDVQKAMWRRFAALERPLWVPAMAALINRRQKTQRYFRWHDSGDLQSVDHLRMIVVVCNLTPGVRHWLPTREYRIVAEFFAEGGVKPVNLNIRLSAHKIGGFVPTFPALRGLVTVSTVSQGSGHSCPAPTQGNSCGSCRACWDLGVDHVDYHLH